jgi:hypothetical protein
MFLGAGLAKDKLLIVEKPPKKRLSFHTVWKGFRTIRKTEIGSGFICGYNAWYAVEYDVNHEAAIKFLSQLALGKQGISVTTEWLSSGKCEYKVHRRLFKRKSTNHNLTKKI